MTSHIDPEIRAEFANERPGKRRRHDVARQACERCRAKKTRCDEKIPCGLCRSLGAECAYGYRKQTRNEASSDSLLRVLARLESKLDNLSAKTLSDESETHASPVTPWATEATQPVFENPPSNSYLSQPDGVVETIPNYPQSTVIPWSAHQTIAWKPVVPLLPKPVQLIVDEYGTDYSTSLEFNRPRLPLGPLPSQGDDGDFLGKLSVSLVKELCDSYFATFHLAYPIVDRTFYLRHTLPTAIHGEFGYDIESCVVLVVMALGCWGQMALAECGSQQGQRRSSSQGGDTGPEHWGSIPDKIPGLNFFNESRRRIGWLMDGNCMQSCQYYLLSGLFYAQTVRPVEWWTMTNRASTCCRIFWQNVPAACDEWVADMQSRLFWNTVMFDAILAQELSLPGGQLDEMSQHVPLPKFAKMKQPSFIPLDLGTDEEDILFHYHFLAQVAHRILLTRAKASIFFTSEYCSPSVEDELYHQLERWRNQLPSALQFNDEQVAPVPETPSEILVVSWLRLRYIIAKWHFGRPLLHKVLSNPDKPTEADLRRCVEAFEQLFKWEPIIKLLGVMGSCMPLRFQICAQLFGQLILVYCFHHFPNVQLQQVLPPQYRSWCAFALGMLQEAAASSPTLAKDAEIATILCQELLY